MDSICHVFNNSNVIESKVHRPEVKRPQRNQDCPVTITTNLHLKRNLKSTIGTSLIKIQLPVKR